MGRPDHERVEFVLRKKEDHDMIEFVRQVKADGSLSEFLRDLIAHAMAGDFNAQADLMSLEAIHELRADQQYLHDELQAVKQAISLLQVSGPNTAALSELQSIVSQLARKVEYLSGRMDGLQTMRAAPLAAHVAPPPEDDDEPLELDIRRNTDEQSASNFLASLSALQGERDG